MMAEIINRVEQLATDYAWDYAESIYLIRWIIDTSRINPPEPTAYIECSVKFLEPVLDTDAESGLEWYRAVCTLDDARETPVCVLVYYFDPETDDLELEEVESEADGPDS